MGKKLCAMTFLILITGMTLCGCERKQSEQGEMEEEQEMVEKPWPVTDIAFSPDGRWLAAARGYRRPSEDGEGEVMVWQTDGWKQKGGFTAPFTDEVRGVGFAADGKSLIAAANKYYRPKSKKEHRIGADGKQLRRAIPRWDGNVVFVWTVSEGEQTQALHFDDFHNIPTKRGAGSVTSMSLSPDGELIGLARSGSIPAILQRKTGRSAYELAGHTGNSHDLSFSPDGKSLVSITHIKPLVRLYNAADGKELARFDIKCANPAHTVWTEDYGYQAAGDTLTHVRFSPDGKQIAVGVSEGSVRILNADLTKQLRSLDVCEVKERVPAIAYAAKADLLAAATESHIRLFEASSGKKLRDWEKDELMLSTLALSPDGKLLAAGYAGKHKAYTEIHHGFVKVWDTKTGRLVKKLD